MTDEQKVKEVYPKAICQCLSDGKSYIIGNHTKRISEGLSDIHPSKKEAWADAAKRILKTKEE